MNLQNLIPKLTVQKFLTEDIDKLQDSNDSRLKCFTACILEKTNAVSSQFFVIKLHIIIITCLILDEKWSNWREKDERRYGVLR